MLRIHHVSSISLTWQVHRGREHGRPARVMVLVVAVVVSARGRGRDGRAVVTVAGGHGSRSSGSGRQVVAHGRIVRPGGGHGRGGPEPVRGVRHLATSGQVTVSHGCVIHVGRGRGAGQPVEVGLVQVRVVHLGPRGGTRGDVGWRPACVHRYLIGSVDGQVKRAATVRSAG